MTIRNKVRSQPQVNYQKLFDEDELGYVTICGTFAAIPFVKGKYIVIHNGFQVYLAKSLDDAKSYITKQIRKVK